MGNDVNLYIDKRKFKGNKMYVFKYLCRYSLCIVLVYG